MKIKVKGISIISDYTPYAKCYHTYPVSFDDMCKENTNQTCMYTFSGRGSIVTIMVCACEKGHLYSTLQFYYISIFHPQLDVQYYCANLLCQIARYHFKTNFGIVEFDFKNIHIHG